jgi:hypothetical protein
MRLTLVIGHYPGIGSELYISRKSGESMCNMNESCHYILIWHDTWEDISIHYTT